MTPGKFKALRLEKMQDRQQKFQESNNTSVKTMAEIA